MFFPLKPPSDQESFEDYNLLKSFDPCSLINNGKWFSRSDFDDSFKKNVYIGTNKLGLKASNRHHWYARMACDSINSPSPIRSWYQVKHRKTLENSKFFKDNPKTALALRKYIASQFRPTAAMAIYSLFNAKKVYDPCGGWGDRLIAAMAMNIDYTCREVNPLVIAGYAAMEQMYEHTGLLNFEYEGSEVNVPDGKFDLIFTSPPYWKVEKYQGEKSSHALYKKFEDWLDNFLLKTLSNCWQALDVGGHMVINVSDVYANHTYNKIVGPVLEKFSVHKPWVMGYQMAKRVNSKSLQEGVFCEPIIVVKKGRV